MPRNLRILSCATLSVLAAGPAGGQSSTLLATSPHPAALEDMSGLDDGTWLTLVNTDPWGRAMEARLDGTLWMREGEPLSIPGAMIGDGDGVFPTLPFVDLAQSRSCPGTYCGILTVRDDVDPRTPPAITPDNDRVLVLGRQVLLQEGAVTSAPEVPAGTRIKTLHRSVFNSHNDALLLVNLLDPTTGEEYPALLRVDVAPGCGPFPTPGENVVFRRGDRLPSGRRFTNFASTEKHTFDFNDRGDWAFVGAFETAIDRVIVLNGRSVLNETQPIPGGIGAATSLQLASVDLNDFGDYVLQTRGSAGAVIIRGNARDPSQARMFMQARHPLPDPDLGSHDLLRIACTDRFGNGSVKNWAPTLITNGGDVIWYGEWSPNGSTVVAAIFVNHKAVVTQGSLVGGAVLEFFGTMVPEFRYEIEASPNGRYVFYEATLGSPVFQEAVLRVDLGESVPYGTDVTGCSYPYLPESLTHACDDLSLGDPVGYGGFPLRNGKSLYVKVEAPVPALASHIALVLARARPSDPCGTPLFGVDVLLDDPLFGVPIVRTVSAGPVFGLAVPTTAPANLAAHVQAFFLRPDGRILSATNAIRFVFGTP